MDAITRAIQGRKKRGAGMTITEATKESECCCSCCHNIRKQDEQDWIYCECEIDGHYIGYVACFENVCDGYKAESEE